MAKRLVATDVHAQCLILGKVPNIALSDGGLLEHNVIDYSFVSNIRLTPLWFASVANALFKRRASHEPNRMLMRENKEFFSFAFDSAHVKYGV